MNLLMGRGDDAARMAKALGLPKYTRRFTLDMPAGDAAVVTVESYVDAGDATDFLCPIFERYRLVKIEDEPGDEGQVNEEAP
jgi:hypothetical protein